MEIRCVLNVVSTKRNIRKFLFFTRNPECGSGSGETRFSLPQGINDFDALICAHQRLWRHASSSFSVTKRATLKIPKTYRLKGIFSKRCERLSRNAARAYAFNRKRDRSQKRRYPRLWANKRATCFLIKLYNYNLFRRLCVRVQARGTTHADPLAGTG